MTDFEVIETGADVVEVVEVGSGNPLDGVEVLSVTAGASSSDGVRHFEHHQDVLANVWIVDHNLGRYPIAWSLFDEQDRLRDEYLVETPTVNRVIVRTDVPSAGRIRMI